MLWEALGSFGQALGGFADALEMLWEALGGFGEALGMPAARRRTKNNYIQKCWEYANAR